MATGEIDKKLGAALDFIRRTGAHQVQVRYSDDTYPVVWFVVALYDGQNPKKIEGFEADASADPLRAALRLCERLADGGQCTHCSRPVGFEPDLLLRMPMDDKICWYQYDPGSNKFVRGCG